MLLSVCLRRVLCALACGGHDLLIIESRYRVCVRGCTMSSRYGEHASVPKSRCDHSHFVLHSATTGVDERGPSAVAASQPC